MFFQPIGNTVIFVAVNDSFEISDECYAVENAVEELKVAATGIIDSNENDGVAT